MGRDPKVQPAINSAWNRWSGDKAANAIFWEFIEEERNNILKEYHFSVLDSAVVGVAVVEIDQETGPRSGSRITGTAGREPLSTD